MAQFKKESDKLLLINDEKVLVEEGILTLLNYRELGVVMTKSGNVLIFNNLGNIVWEYEHKNYISEIWKKDENTLCMYDGQTDIWVDINKLEVVRRIWNPWGLHNPKKNK